MNIAKCKSCGAEIVYLQTKKGNNIPCNANTVDSEDVIYDSKKHRTHFSDCPDAIKFRKNKGVK